MAPPDDCLGIVVEAHTPEGGGRLIFPALGARRIFIFPHPLFKTAAAGNRTVPAAVPVRYISVKNFFAQAGDVRELYHAHPSPVFHRGGPPVPRGVGMRAA